MRWKTMAVLLLVEGLAASAPARADDGDGDGVAAEDKKEASKPKPKPTPNRPPRGDDEKEERRHPSGVPQPERHPTTPERQDEALPSAPRREPERARPEPARVTRPTARVEDRAETHRTYDGHVPAYPIYRTTDHRYARPAARHVRAYPEAHHPPPRFAPYRPWYTHWWVHPYYRWVHATVVVVWFDFTPDPWAEVWVPPPRGGWAWVPGHWAGRHWIPGHWVPVGPPPAYGGVSYTYVPGWWMGTVYVDGYWRSAERAGWVWVDGYYLDDGTYVWGHWEPAGPGPEGYVWEPGFWDGEQWVEGFWRPEFRAGYRWVSAYYDDDGVYHGGYWEPVEQKPGCVWIPGWFDGDKWVPGYWVTQEEYDAADPKDYQPEDGWNDGWKEEESAKPDTSEGAPLAVPVTE